MDDFQVVSRKKAARRRNIKPDIAHAKNSAGNCDKSVDVQKFLTKLERCRLELSGSEFWINLQDIFQSAGLDRVSDNDVLKDEASRPPGHGPHPTSTSATSLLPAIQSSQHDTLDRNRLCIGFPDTRGVPGVPVRSSGKQTSGNAPSVLSHNGGKDAVLGSLPTACGTCSQTKTGATHTSRDGLAEEDKVKDPEAEDEVLAKQRPDAQSVTSVQDRVAVEDVVCYGLGNFTACSVAACQLALLLLLKDHFQIPLERCLVHDPVFAPAEIQLLEELGCSHIDQNEVGARPTSGPTLFYMPHCGRPLYNNVLHANWDPHHLQTLSILGNSFQNITLRTPGRVLEKEGAYILRALDLVLEVPVDNIFKHKDIFNDMSLHHFHGDRLKNALKNLWEDKEKPIYDEHSTEVIFHKT